MKPHTNYILMGLGLAALSGPLSSRAATIWNGPLITFTQAAPYPNPGDRDQLTPNVSLTRASPVPSSGTGGIFNGVTETSHANGIRWDSGGAPKIVGVGIHLAATQIEFPTNTAVCSAPSFSRRQGRRPSGHRSAQPVATSNSSSTE